MQLAKSLTEVGMDVHVVVLKTNLKSKEVEFINGIHFHSISLLTSFFSSFLKNLKADIYHSQNQNLLTVAAQYLVPRACHIITCRDPRNLADWWIEFRFATWKRRFWVPFSYLAEESYFLRRVIRKADLIGCPSSFLFPKVMKMYKLKMEPIELPNIENVPPNLPLKANKPTVLWVGRFAKRKNPERFLTLAQNFPNVDFLILGNSEEKSRQFEVETLIKNCKNVTNLGFINKFENDKFYKHFEKSWILVNTSIREGLPITFIEAASRGCAILSQVNPNNYAETFGYHVKSDDFEIGLTTLLKNDLWRIKGQLAYEQVKNVNGKEKSIKKYIDAYTKCIKVKSVKV